MRTSTDTAIIHGCRRILLPAIILTMLAAQTCWAVTYANITEISANALKNAVQVTIRGDGLLEWECVGKYPENDANSGHAQQITMRFPTARSAVRSFTDISKFPVSYVQTSSIQGAADGVGVEVVLNLFEESDYQLARSTDNQSIIITVKSSRTLDEVQRKAASTTGDQKTGLDCCCENGLITIHALKADMLKVFGQVARASALDIVVDDAVSKRIVSMSIEKTPAEAALQSIASAYGLALTKKDGVYMVSEGVPTDLATYQMSGTASFPMKYVRAQTAAGLLPTFLYSYLHVNNEQNALVVSAPAQMLDKIRGDLRKVDIAPPQILIEAIVVESSSVDDLTASLGLSKNNRNMSGTLDTGSGEVTYSTIGKLPSEFQANLKALIAEHKAKVDSRPRMAVVNGQTADIFIGAQRFIRVQSPNNSGTTNEYIQGVDVGTTISLTPWTGTNDEITINLSPEVSNIVELERLTGLPTVSTRRASTTIRVKDGETVVIGGLTQKQDYYTKRKIPVLGDLPLVGGLFQSKSRNTTDSDLVMLITPRILTDDGHSTNQAEESRLKERMLSTE